MAKITTYTAPTERVRPSDIGYTANINLARRLAGFATEEASALREGGRLQGQAITSSRRADVELMKFINSLNQPEPAARGGRGGGTTSGSLGPQDSGRGATQQPSRIAVPQEGARAASAMAQVLGATGHTVYPSPDRYPLDPYQSKGAVLKSYDVDRERIDPLPGYKAAEFDDFGRPVGFGYNNGPPVPEPIDYSNNVGNTGDYGESGFENFTGGYSGGGAVGSPITYKATPPASQSDFLGWVASVASGAASSIANAFGGTSGDTSQILSDRGE